MSASYCWVCGGKLARASTGHIVFAIVVVDGQKVRTHKGCKKTHIADREPTAKVREEPRGET